jgi:hypothetical protein
MDQEDGLLIWDVSQHNFTLYTYAVQFVWHYAAFIKAIFKRLVLNISPVVILRKYSRKSICYFSLK